MIKNSVRWAAVAAAFALGACETIGTAPKGTPRVEVEVVYEVEPAFPSPLAAADPEALREVLRDAVRPLADVGLRFYPVPSENYAEGQRRPEYVLTVRAHRLEVDRRLELDKPKPTEGEAEPEPASIEATVRSLECSVDVRFEKRRMDAPNLVVGQSIGKGSASPRRDDPSRPWSLVKDSNESNETSITTNMLQRALGDAATRALGALQRPIDREFESKAAENPSGS